MMKSTRFRISNPYLYSKIDVYEVVNLALNAGKAIMEVYEKEFTVEYKPDESPLTEADKKAHRIIANGLKKMVERRGETLKTRFPLLSEEGRNIPYEKRKNWDYYWCVDPIDGTKEFINKNGEFTVNIALVYRNVPVLGVVYAPALGELYWAEKGKGAKKLLLSGSNYSLRKEVMAKAESLPLKKKENEETFVVVASKSHRNEATENFIRNLMNVHENISFVSKGSSLKLMMIAEGSADIYPRLAPTMEWDTAAADIIVKEAGKRLYPFTFSGRRKQKTLVYNKKNLLNPWFIAE